MPTFEEQGESVDDNIRGIPTFEKVLTANMPRMAPVRDAIERADRQWLSLASIDASTLGGAFLLDRRLMGSVAPCGEEHPHFDAILAALVAEIDSDKDGSVTPHDLVRAMEEEERSGGAGGAAGGAASLDRNVTVTASSAGTGLASLLQRIVRSASRDAAQADADVRKKAAFHAKYQSMREQAMKTAAAKSAGQEAQRLAAEEKSKAAARAAARAERAAAVAVVSAPIARDGEGVTRVLDGRATSDVLGAASSSSSAAASAGEAVDGEEAVDALIRFITLKGSDDSSPQWKLLYSASRQGHTSGAFHAAVDGRKNTVTLYQLEGDPDKAAAVAAAAIDSAGEAFAAGWTPAGGQAPVGPAAGSATYAKHLKDASAGQVAAGKKAREDAAGQWATLAAFTEDSWDTNSWFKKRGGQQQQQQQQCWTAVLASSTGEAAEKLEHTGEEGATTIWCTTGSGPVFGNVTIGVFGGRDGRSASEEFRAGGPTAADKGYWGPKGGAAASDGDGAAETKFTSAYTDFSTSGVGGRLEDEEALGMLGEVPDPDDKVNPSFPPPTNHAFLRDGKWDCRVCHLETWQMAV